MLTCSFHNEKSRIVFRFIEFIPKIRRANAVSNILRTTTYVVRVVIVENNWLGLQGSGRKVLLAKPMDLLTRVVHTVLSK
jgi:hypothetical protein